jgi:hypothetical protein
MARADDALTLVTVESPGALCIFAKAALGRDVTLVPLERNAALSSPTAGSSAEPGEPVALAPPVGRSRATPSTIGSRASSSCSRRSQPRFGALATTRDSIPSSRAESRSSSTRRSARWKAAAS